MQLPQPIDVRSTQLQSADGGATFPVGDYPSVALRAEIRASGTNERSGLIEYTMQHIAPSPYAGQQFKKVFNVFNENPEAVRIGTQELASFGACVGVYSIVDTDMLLNKPLITCWRPRRDKPEQTELKGFKDAHGNDPINAGRGPNPNNPQGPTTAAAPAPQPQQAGGWGQAAQGQPPAQQQAPAAGWAPATAPAPAAGFGPPGGHQQPGQQQPATQQQQPAQTGWGGGAPAPAAPAQQPAQAWTQGGAAPAAGGQPAWAQQR